MARRHGLIVALAWAAVVAPAEAAPVFTLSGDGAERLRPGVLAAEAAMRSTPTRLAAADGRVAFLSDGAVWFQRGPRLVRLPTPEGAEDLVFSPAGDLLVATCPNGAARVYRAAPDREPTPVAGRPGSSRSAGDGGPSSAAAFECVQGLGFAADGALLLADPVAHRIRRIGLDGGVSTAAGVKPPPARSGEPAREILPDGEVVEAAGDGGPASASVLALPTDVAGLPGGGFAVLDAGKVRIVGADGVIHATGAPEAVAIASDPSGLLILEPAGHVWRRSADGAITSVASLGSERAGITPYLPVANDPFGQDEPFATDVVAAPDGGVLLAADFAVHYVPPPTPSRLAVAIRPATRVPSRGLTVSVVTTAPSQLRIGVWRGGRRAALLTAQVAAGDAAIPIPGVRAAGLYRIHVQAADHDEIAAAGASVLVGGRLPVVYARDFLRVRLNLLEAFDDAEHVTLRCGRMSVGRVDCAMRGARGRCAGIASLRVERDGTLSLWGYDGGRRCGFDRARGEPPTRRGPAASSRRSLSDLGPRPY